MKNLYRDIRTMLLESGMPKEETQAVTLLLMEKVCGMTTIEALTNDPKGETHREKLIPLVQRVVNGEPVQYVLGEADFCDMSIKVRPGVLIPRKETEELVNWIVEGLHSNCQLSTVNCQLLDIGTGSGCIAIALAKKLEKVEVEVDYYDVIVSNPPYICKEEARDMERNVLEHEPRLALFVPDNDPLLFYRRIGELGIQRLKRGGELFFEINRRFGNEIVKLLEGFGYSGVEIRKDMFGNNRMIKAIKPL